VLDAGLCNYVVITYGHSALSGGGMELLLKEVTREDAVFGHFGLFGHFGATGGYALAARRAMHAFNTGPDTWKHIAVGERKWANLNPKAVMYEQKMTFEDYYDARWVVEPFRLFDNCLINDGGRAVVVTSTERAKDLRHPPALILGMGQHNPSWDISQATYMAGPTGAKRAGDAAFRMAGLSLEDVDACQIYDCFTYTVEITLQDYGFFGPGEGKDWFKDGTIEPGGKMPVNTSGGQLSEAYFMGLTPLSEAVMQIMGRCGERQLGPKTKTREPKIILCSDNGGVLQSHSCYILGRT
jgi:acetyl-CoA acetyltransferase